MKSQEICQGLAEQRRGFNFRLLAVATLLFAVTSSPLIIYNEKSQDFLYRVEKIYIIPIHRWIEKIID